MESHEEEYKHNIWEIYRKEWATASPEKRIELDKRMHRWQELMKDGWSAQQAYYKTMEEELDFKVAEEPSDKQLAIPSPPRMRKAPLIFLSLALVAAIVYCIVITGDRNALDAELESVQGVLASTRAEVSSTKQTLASTQVELNSLNDTIASMQAEIGSLSDTLASTNVELNSTKQTLASTQVELDALNDTLTSTQAELNSTKQILSSVQNELGATESELEAAQAELKLYKDTLGMEVFSDMQPPYKKLRLGSDLEINLSNYQNATNPTWQQLRTFLRNDTTDDRNYSKYEYNCTDFAEKLHNRAEAAGIKVAFVVLSFIDRDVGHALNAFTTTDKGIVYVDCTGRTLIEELREGFIVQLYGENYAIEYDKIAYVMKGKEYGLIGIDRATSPKYSYYKQMGKSLSDWEIPGLVESIKIYW